MISTSVRVIARLLEMRSVRTSQDSQGVDKGQPELALPQRRGLKMTVKALPKIKSQIGGQKVVDCENPNVFALERIHGRRRV
jgi:hypothetical protein